MGLSRSDLAGTLLGCILSFLGFLGFQGCGENSLGDGLPDAVGCSTCHGSDKNPAPPVSIAGAFDPAARSVGAHQAHLQDGELRKAVGCAECHVVPTEVDQAGHVDPLPAEVVFGSLATGEGLSPSWDRESATCQNTYCHGTTLAGGSNKRPEWTTVNGSQDACGTCHGNPPPLPHSQSTDCHLCHSGTVTSGGDIVAGGGKHIDGAVDAPEMDCSLCHGDQDSPAPPLDTQGNSDTSDRGVGAHREHLADSTWHAPVACDECHVVPADISDPGHNDTQLPAELVWGRLASADGAQPALNSATLTCSGTYCHGTTLHPGGTLTEPVWTVVDGTQAACGTCHGLPPGGIHPAQLACETCHSEVIGPGQSWVAPDRHIDGVVDVSDYHPEGYDDGTVHGPDFHVNPSDCTRCHGSDLDGGSVNVSCETCHPGFQTNCVYCHGGTDNQSGAPPENVAGDTATTLRGVGAHTAHVTAGSAWHADISCSACHRVPSAALDPGHIDPSPAELTWGGISAADGASPQFDQSTLTCNSVYCHGTTLDPGGANTTPVWTGGGSQAACGTCHGLPPGGPHPAQAGCDNCHGEVIGPGLAWVDPSRHVDGVVDLSDYHPDGYIDGTVHGPDFNNNPASCTPCHGNDLDGGSVNVSCETCHPGFQTNCLYCHGGTDNQTAAPPEDVAGGTATVLRGVGAHTAHVTTGSTWRADIPCSTCHVVPSAALDPGHIDPSPAEMTWGGISDADGAAPDFDGPTTTCNAVYCHGETLHPGGSNTTPDWTAGGSQAACGTCHGLPPGAPHPNKTDCETCHDQVIAAGGVFVAPQRHVDGVVDVSGGCGACHPVPPTPLDEQYAGAGGAHTLHTVTLGYPCATCHGHDGTGPLHNQGNGTVLRANVDMLFDPSVVFPGGTTMANAGVPSENYNSGNPTCFVGCHNPVPGDLPDLDNPAVWTDTTISCAECHDRPGTEPDVSHDLDPDAEDDPTIRAGCRECHDVSGHAQGAVAIIDPDPGDTDSFANTQVSGLCRTCHDGGAGTFFAGQTPQDESVYWTTPTAHDGAGLDCDTCHDHHGRSSGTALVNREESLCAPCHIEVAEMDDANTPTHHHVVDAEQSGTAPLECTTCHEPHRVQRTPWRPITDPNSKALWPATDVPNDSGDDPAAAFGDRRFFCLTCHDGSWPGAIDIAAELGDRDVVNSGFYRGNRNLHFTHQEKLDAPNNQMPCTYCHNVHGNTGTQGINRGALLYNWIDVNNYPYNGKGSCSTGDPLNECH